VTEPLLDRSLSDALEAIGDERADVAAGAAAAIATASAAGLTAMALRRSPAWNEAASAAGQADVLRRRATDLIPLSAEAFAEAAAALSVARDAPNEDDAPGRGDWQLGEALRRAAEAPLAVAEVAADVATLAAEAAAHEEGAHRPDLVSACLLAEAAAAACAHLVAVNLTAVQGDERVANAQRLAASAAACRSKVLDA
jgi:formiminotetrahydrofolate cyclodeaminase